MASACLNSISPENLLDRSPNYSSYTWFNPRLSSSSPAKKHSDLPENVDPAKKISDLPEDSDLKEFDGFEFSLHDPATMLPADELFSDGKLVPLHLSVIRQEPATSSSVTVSSSSGVNVNITCPDTPFSRRTIAAGDSFAADPYLFSPRAPRCSSRWRELLGFGNKRANSLPSSLNGNNSVTGVNGTNGVNAASRSIRQFLHRSSKSSDASSSSLLNPLLKDLDTESVSISSRPSLSSSSSGHDLDDLPRLSLDSDKPSKVNINTSNRPKTRLVKCRTDQRAATRVGKATHRRSADTTAAATATDRGVSIDSPRMNSSGKIVFHSLERSSSSPSSLNGAPRFKHRGMERSYSANVRITPVLNVPVCSLRGGSKSGGVFGFPIFSSQQKREGSSNNNANISGQNRSQRFMNSKSQKD
uniref:uncharacterized protein LOC122600755 n=1 Tax=Erigeron canadensis TaxID=72917 RepID=UPI001CB94715|nr:uncharacterized protein LOC122600755 [Erigeron canadensis]